MTIISFEGTKVNPRITRLRDNQQALHDKIEKQLRKSRVGQVEGDDEEEEASSSESVEYPRRQHKRKERSPVSSQRRNFIPPAPVVPVSGRRE